jgi:hypothetical protein
MCIVYGLDMLELYRAKTGRKYETSDFEVRRDRMGYDGI